MLISGFYSLSEKTNTITASEDCLFIERDGVQACITTNKGRENEVFEAYLQHGIACVNETDDLFLACFFKDGSLHCFADITSSPFNLYYTVVNKTLFYSTSLKKLITDSCIECRLDLFSARVFLLNGFVFGERTLIQGINKLAPGHELIVGEEGPKQIKYSYSVPKIAKQKAKDSLISTLHDEIDCYSKTLNNIAMPLSSGFDSNFILTSLIKNPDISINAYTIGGSVGSNEIPAVQENVSSMKNVTLKSAIVNANAFDSFTDIVWRLDGSVFEVGIFLQYALAKLVADSSEKNLICGECADQQFNKNYLHDLNHAVSGDFRPNEHFYLFTNPYLASNQIILKKSAILLNSFGIKGLYPYASKAVTEVAVALARENGISKKYYKKKCLEIFPEQIVKNISKIGGATSNEAIFSKERYSALQQYLAQNDIARRIAEFDAGIYTPFSTKLSKLQWKLNKAMKEFKSAGLKGLLKKYHDSSSNQNMDYGIKLLYLVLFNELFCSGKYNASFASSSAPVKTSDIVNI